MHNHDDKYPARPGFEPGTSRLQAPVDKNEPSGLARFPIIFFQKIMCRLVAVYAMRRVVVLNIIPAVAIWPSAAVLFFRHVIIAKPNRAGALVQWLRLPDWEVGDRGFELHSDKMFLPRSLVEIQYCG